MRMRNRKAQRMQLDRETTYLQRGGNEEDVNEYMLVVVCMHVQCVIN